MNLFAFSSLNLILGVGALRLHPADRLNQFLKLSKSTDNEVLSGYAKPGCWPDELAAPAILAWTYNGMPYFFSGLRNPYKFIRVLDTHNITTGGCWKLVGYKGNGADPGHPIASVWVDGTKKEGGRCFRVWAGLTTEIDMEEGIYARQKGQSRPDGATYKMTYAVSLGKGRDKRGCPVVANPQALRKVINEKFADYLNDADDSKDCVGMPYMYSGHSNGGALISLLAYCHTTYGKAWGGIDSHGDDYGAKDLDPSKVPIYTYGARPYYPIAEPYPYPGSVYRFWIADDEDPMKPIADPIPFDGYGGIGKTGKMDGLGWTTEISLRIDKQGHIWDAKHDPRPIHYWTSKFTTGLYDDPMLHRGIAEHDICNYIAQMFKVVKYQKYGGGESMESTKKICDGSFFKNKFGEQRAHFEQIMHQNFKQMKGYLLESMGKRAIIHNDTAD